MKNTNRASAVCFEVNEDWVSFVINYNDLFMTDHCGYWAHSIAHIPDKGWLIRDMRATMPATYSDLQALDFIANQTWHKDLTLPLNYFEWDRRFAINAHICAVGRWGEDWFEQSDGNANCYDLVVQEVLFGKQIYFP